MTGAFIRIASLLMFGLSTAFAQEPLETSGAWRLFPDGEDFALRTPAVSAPDSSLSLHCRKAREAYVFEIKSPVLTNRASGEDIRIGFKVDDGDQAWFNLSTGPDGTIPISHLTAFWIIHAALTRKDAKSVAFTAADHTWQFALDGLRDLSDILIERCGFEPPRSEPERGRTPPAVPNR